MIDRRRVEWASADADALLALRVEVFCDEQGVPDSEEPDADDPRALHFGSFDGDAAIGVCRVVIEPDHARLGRMAVAPAARRTGEASRLLAVAEAEVAARGVGAIRIHAQVSALGFWVGHGYVPVGERFDEAGLEHVAMAKALTRVLR